jgi:hypothetical protein
MAVPTVCASLWDDIRAYFERHRDELTETYPDAVEEIGLIHIDRAAHPGVAAD